LHPTTTQTLATQAPVPSAGLQTVEQPPQWLGSTEVSTQAPEQFVRPGPQLVAQVPAAQTCPAAQAWPQLPQLLGSD